MSQVLLGKAIFFQESEVAAAEAEKAMEDAAAGNAVEAAQAAEELGENGIVAPVVENAVEGAAEVENAVEAAGSELEQEKAEEGKAEEEVGEVEEEVLSQSAAVGSTPGLNSCHVPALRRGPGVGRLLRRNGHEAGALVEAIE